MPDGRVANALSVGAKMVRALLELLSCESIWLATAVVFMSLIRMVNSPAFSSILVMLVGPAGAGALAG